MPTDSYNRLVGWLNYIDHNVRTVKLNLIGQRKDMLNTFKFELESIEKLIVELNDKEDISSFEAVNLESKREKICDLLF